MKTNRKWLLETSEIDVLLQMNDSLRNFHSPAGACVAVALGIHSRLGRCGKFNNNCRECVSAWLNEERKDG